MALKYVIDSAAAKSLHAYIILDSQGKLAGKILAHYGNTRQCTVNLSDWTEHGGDIQKGTAGGGGYDKLATVLARMKFGGLQLPDQCGTNPEVKAMKAKYDKCHAEGKLTERKKEAFNRASKSIGASFNNWNRELHKWDSLYCMEWNRYLEAHGYKVVQVI